MSKDNREEQGGLSRRRMLQVTGTAAGALAVTGIGASGAKAATSDAAAGRTGTMKDLKHVVVMMQENRSFDPSMKVVLTPTCLTSHARMRLRA